VAAETKRNRWGPLTLFAMLLAAFVMLAPLIWTLLLSLKENEALVGNSGAALAPPYTLENYTSILQGNQVFRWLINSIIVSGGTTLGVLAVCSLAGYGFARLEFPFRRTLFIFVLLGLAIPEQAVILPQHQLFADLRLHNSYPG
jgi:multiple sugar transport system permease protein